MDPKNINTPEELSAAAAAWNKAQGSKAYGAGNAGYIWGWESHNGEEPFPLHERVYRPGWGCCPNCGGAGEAEVIYLAPTALTPWEQDGDVDMVRPCDRCCGVGAIPLHWGAPVDGGHHGFAEVF